MDTSTRQERNDPLGGLALDPSNELRFKGPFDNEFSSVTLSISNPTEKRIAFKIKTTAPKRYCVKPNSGVLDPTKSMKVNVLLQPFTYDANEKLKHKFMVQYMYLTDEETKLDAQDILNRWKDVSSSRLLDIKLKCLFESDTETTGGSSSSNNNNNNNINRNNTTQVVPQTPAPIPSSQQQDSQINNDNNLNEIRSRQTSAKVEKQQSASTQQQQQQQTNRNSIPPNDTALYESASSSLSMDNYMNEVRALKTENQRLLKEIDRLKGEEVRLKKLALPNQTQPQQQQQQQQKSRQDLSSSAASDPLQNLLMLFQNKSIWIIVALLAVIIYLLLFK